MSPRGADPDTDRRAERGGPSGPPELNPVPPTARNLVKTLSGPSVMADKMRLRRVVRQASLRAGEVGLAL